MKEKKKISIAAAEDSNYQKLSCNEGDVLILQSC